LSRIAILTDSTANLTPELVQKNHIHVIPLKILWKEEVLRDGVDITPDEFYTRLGKESASPTTSQATVAEFSQVFEKLAADYDAIFAPLISSGVSGTVDSAVTAAKEFSKCPLEVYDTHQAAGGLALVALAAAQVAYAGASLEMVSRAAHKVSESMHTYFKVDTLKYLHRGGRIGGAARFLGAALGIKPILYINQGRIDAFERVRTSKKALKRLIDIILEKSAGKPSHVVVMHASALEEAKAAGEVLTRELNCVEFEILDLSPAIGAHVGPGTLGIAIYPD
jgi:DegV family protein with EDD domain